MDALPEHKLAVRRLVGTNLIIPHIVGNSGVLRNFSAYFAQLINVQDKTNLQVMAVSPLILPCLLTLPSLLASLS